MDVKTAQQREQDIGSALRRARIQAMLTQQDLAKLAGLSLPTIKNLENGRGNRVASLIQVASALGLADSLLPPVPTISPQQVLRARSHVAPTRVRHRSAQ